MFAPGRKIVCGTGDGLIGVNRRRPAHFKKHPVH
jgi:hypothetical protein